MSQLSQTSSHIMLQWGGHDAPPPQPVTMSNSVFRGCRTISQHLNDLKKENFSLKLRIYFLEEKIQQKFEESGDDVHKRVSEMPETVRVLDDCISVSLLRQFLCGSAENSC